MTKRNEAETPKHCRLERAAAEKARKSQTNLDPKTGPTSETRYKDQSECNPTEAQSRWMKILYAMKMSSQAICGAWGTKGRVLGAAIGSAGLNKPPAARTRREPPTSSPHSGDLHSTPTKPSAKAMHHLLSSFSRGDHRAYGAFRESRLQGAQRACVLSMRRCGKRSFLPRRGRNGPSVSVHCGWYPRVG